MQRPEPDRLSTLTLTAVIAMYGLIIFGRLRDPFWMYVGDTLSSAAFFSYHYFGLMRGEYPLWNPLVRGGEPMSLAQIGGLASPLQNAVSLLSSWIGVRDFALVYTFWMFCQIVLYVLGIYLLLRTLTEDKRASAFAGILAVTSATVFFHTYHVTFIMAMFPVPWLILSGILYARTKATRHLLLLGISSCLAVYSYLVTMPTTFLAFAFLSAAILYHPPARRLWEEFQRVPRWHWPFLLGMWAVFLLPALLASVLYSPEATTISFAHQQGFALTKDYELTYQTVFERMRFSDWRKPYLWMVTFLGRTGAVFNEQALRYFVGPLAALFIPVALWSKNRIAWTMGITALLCCFLAEDLPPVNLIYRLPLFGFIRNGTWFMQFVLFSLIIIAAIGFHELTAWRNPRGKRVFAATAGVLLVICLNQLPTALRVTGSHDVIALGSSAAAALIALAILWRVPAPHAGQALLLLGTACAGCIMLLIDHTPHLAGLPNHDLEVLQLRHRTDPKLNFSMTRPAVIQEINADFRTTAENDFGADEYSSYVTLRDNAFDSAGRAYGLSSNPILRQTLRFSLLPGAGSLTAQKFHLFDRIFISRDRADMATFRKDPALLSAAVARGIALADSVGEDSPGISISPFDEGRLREALAGARKPMEPAISVRDYKANSIAFSVSAAKPGLLVYTDSWDPDWQAWLDGRRVPIRKVFHTFKGIDLPQGTHEVLLRYRGRMRLPILLMHVIFLAALSVVLASLPRYLRRTTHH